MFRKLILIPAFAALTLASGAQAQTQAPASSQTITKVERKDVPVQARMSMHVNALVLEDLKQFVTDDEKVGALFLRMVLLSKQEAIAISCDDYNLDKQRMVALMLRTIGPINDGVDTDTASSNLNRALRQYNTMLGGELAQFAYDPTGYCTAATVLYKDLAEYPPEQSMLAITPAE